MSFCESLKKKLAMCPCSEGKDIPQKEQNGVIENHQNFDHVENGFDVIVASSDSGSDEEVDNLAAQGYISLAQCEDDAVVSNDIAQAEIEAPPGNSSEDSEQCINVTSEASSAFSSTQNSQMAEDQVNLIKSVMMNIQLPSSAIPDWAKKIPEEKWKQPLVSALKHRTSNNNEKEDGESEIQ